MGITIEVSNLGPLREAKLEFGDLNVFIGDNNTGKTFFATVVHRTLAAGLSFPRRLRQKGVEIPELLVESIKNYLRGEESESEMKERIISSPDDNIKIWAHTIVENYLRSLGENIREDIAYALGAEPRKLRRQTKTRSASNCYIKISSSNPSWETEIRFDSDDVKVSVGDTLKLVVSHLELRTFEGWGRISRDGREIEFTQFLNLSSPYHDRIYSKVYRRLLHLWPNRAVHLPADRSGIMQSHTALASSLTRQAVTAGIRRIELPTLPGTSADFLALVLEMADADSYLGAYSDRHLVGRRGDKIVELATDLEDELRAEFEVHSYSEGVDAVVAVTPEGEFPMSRVSSMLSELAPLLLVLKGGRLSLGLLTIDEPEAHLHPNMQVKLATFLVRLVNNGVKIILTTHSDFFVTQFNNMMRQNELSKIIGVEQANGLPALNSAGVRALEFSRANGSCIARESSIESITGIDQATFTDVKKGQYDQTATSVNELFDLEESS